MFEGDKGVHIGTSSWSSKDWVGPFYPPGTKPADFISHYGSVYDTVEVDATFYRMPTAANVNAWRNRTPDGFKFALKTPRIITHEKVLVDAEDDMAHFLETLAALGDRLGPVLLQFPYFNKKAFATAAPFLDRLDGFLEKLSGDFRFAVEVRNKRWIAKPLQQICEKHGAALAWIEQAWMPRADEWLALTGGPSTDFAYIRWLGDRKEIEAITTGWGETVIDRTDAMRRWVDVFRELRRRQIEIFGYFNNHFAGHAPDSVEIFRKLLAEL